MKVKVTISRNNKIIHSDEYEVSVEGDLDHAVTDAMKQARGKSGFAEQWGFFIAVDKAV